MSKTLAGQVVAAFGRHYEVETTAGTTISCVTRGKKGGVACGDRIEIELTSPNQGVIKSILPRTSLLFRSDAFKEKVIAANASQIIVVVAAVPSFYEDLVNRCLLAAEAAGLKVLIVLNKCDLAAETQAALAKLQLYRDLGYPLLTLSATHDISPLLPYLQGETSVLVGQSGMGKSSIINALLPEVQAHTREISEVLNSGKHTTTHARLYHLDADSHIIDSPGMQEFGLHHVKPDDIAHAFVEFRPCIGHCRFSNCRHLVEPGCAVLAAAAAGRIDPRRLETYRKLVG
jgi:ribosome biogenesis GTPase